MSDGTTPQTTTNPIVKWVITLVVLAAVGFALYFYKTTQLGAQAAQNANMPEPAASVSAEQATSVSFQKKLKISGEVQAFKQLTISNELTGKIVKLNAKSGAVVKQGQILLELDHSDEDARLIAAQAQLRLNQQTHQRYLKLLKNKEISEELVDQAQAAVDIAKSNIAVLMISIDKKKITAPFDAHVGIHNVEVGQYLDKNTAILHLVGVNDFTWVDFNLPQVYQELALGESIELLPIDSDTGYTAEIIAVNPELSQSSRHLKYRAQIAASELALKPHTLVNVSVPIAASQTLISVPDLAITRDQLGTYVFLLEPSEAGAYRAKKVKVQLGERLGSQVMIISGLEVGQLIATEGAFKLMPGMKVFVAQPTPNV
ncbi:MAG: efflux RND transporter periplasmic adaptor subunit [Thalassotalea sp.]